MIKKFLLPFLLIFLSTSLYANFQVSYLEGSKDYASVEEVIGKEFIQISPSKSLGYKKYAWLKVRIENNSLKEEENYLSLSNIQVMRSINFYTVFDGKIIKSDTGFSKYKNSRIGNALIYKNRIEASSSIDVYIHIKAMSNIYFEINSGSYNHIISKITDSPTILILLSSALVTLGIYYIFIYIFTPNRAYIYYTLFTFSVVILAFHIYGGYAYFFDYFKTATFSLIFILLIPLFTLLFFKSIYKDDGIFKKYLKYINSLIVVFIIGIIYYVLGRLDVLPYFTVSLYGTLLYFISFVIVMIIAIILFRNKVQYSGIFLMGYSANFIGSIVSIMFFSGKVPYNTFTFYANMIGGLIEAILFSILLTFKIRQVYKDKEDAIGLSKIQDFKLNIMSETIDYISHQWRQPLTQINSSVMAIDNLINQEKVDFKKLDKELLYIENTTSYMSMTIDDFKNLLSTKKKDEVFGLKNIILNVTSVLEKVFKTNGISLEVNANEELFIKGSKGDIAQTLLILLNNAKDELIEKNLPQKRIEIHLFSLEDSIILQVSDNAGGVQEDLKEKIFEMNYTTKGKKNGSGLGLYIAKIIVEKKLNGSLFVENKNGGACFSINLKNRVLNS